MRKICPYCGASFDLPYPDYPDFSGNIECPHCKKAWFNLAEEMPEEQKKPHQEYNSDDKPPTPPRRPTPKYKKKQAKNYKELPVWEQKGPFFKKLFKTIPQVLLHPTGTFSAPTDAEIGPSIIFSLSMCILSASIYSFWFSVFNQTIVIPQQFFLGPVVALPMFFIFAGYCHAMLLVFNGAHNSFSHTFRVIAYCTATNIFVLIPIGGDIIASLWFLFIFIAGLAATHNTGKIRVILALLAPALFFFGLFYIIFTLGPKMQI